MFCGSTRSTFVQWCVAPATILLFAILSSAVHAVDDPADDRRNEDAFFRKQQKLEKEARDAGNKLSAAMTEILAKNERPGTEQARRELQAAQEKLNKQGAIVVDRLTPKQKEAWDAVSKASQRLYKLQFTPEEKDQLLAKNAEIQALADEMDAARLRKHKHDWLPHPLYTIVNVKDLETSGDKLVGKMIQISDCRLEAVDPVSSFEYGTPRIMTSSGYAIDNDDKHAYSSFSFKDSSGTPFRAGLWYLNYDDQFAKSPRGALFDLQGWVTKLEGATPGYAIICTDTVVHRSVGPYRAPAPAVGTGEVVKPIRGPMKNGAPTLPPPEPTFPRRKPK